MRTALILEGGAMRGMFTCGVLDILMENGVRFDGAAGVSAGATFGCNIKSRQPGRAVRYNKCFCADPRYGSLRSFLRTGDVFDADFCYRELPDVLDPFDRETFAADPMEFWIGATDIRTGEAVFHRCEKGGHTDIEWMRASASIPLLSRPVALDGRLLLDGGTAAPVPYRFMMEEQGYDRAITVLTQPAGFIKQPQKGMPLIRLRYARYPRLAQALADRSIRYNALYQHIEERAKAGETLILRPAAPLNIASMCSDPAELERVYQLGRTEAERMLPAVIEFLR